MTFRFYIVNCGNQEVECTDDEAVALAWARQEVVIDTKYNTQLQPEATMQQRLIPEQTLYQLN